MGKNFELGVGGLAVGLCLLACAPERSDKALPDSRVLGSPRGYRIARTITHFHSPYSYDACDSNGLPGGKVKEECYNHLVEAMCQNRVNFLFLTDHPDRMADFEIRDLLHLQDTDEVISMSGAAYAKKVKSCANGFEPTFLVGFESEVMAMGMTQHLETTAAARASVYQLNSGAVRIRLQTEADALVVVPHTESRTLDSIRSLEPDAIEIYNFHATLVQFESQL